MPDGARARGVRVLDEDEQAPEPPVGQGPGGASHPRTAAGLPDEALRARRLSYQPALDGLRGIGLFFVMASHAGFEATWAKGGFLWVSMFFTLSGYLITTLLVVEHRRTGRISLSSFWAKRFRRLMPGAIITLVGVCAFGLWVADAAQLQRLRGDGLAALFYVANWQFIRTGTSYQALFTSPSPVQHFWTLSIEEQFYAMFPLLLLGGLWIGRGRWRNAALAIGALTVGSIAWMRFLFSRGASIDRLYFGTDTRLPELTMGILLAIVLSYWRPDTKVATRIPMAVAGVVAIGIMLLLTVGVRRTDEWLYQGGFAAFALVSCTAVTSAMQPGSPVKRALSLTPLVWMGRLSYTAYLFHWPVFLTLEEKLGFKPALGQDGSWRLLVVGGVVTFGLSWVSSTYVETPIRYARRLNGWRAVVAVPVGFAVVIAGLVFVTADPPKVQDIGSQTDFGRGPAPPSVPGDPSAPAGSGRPVKIMVVGDSQAYVLGNALTRWAARSDGRAVVWNMAVAGCGVVRGGETYRFDKVAKDVPCDQWPTSWGEAVRRFDPDVVMVLTGGWDWIDRKLPEWGDWKHFGDPVFDDYLVSEYVAAFDVLSSAGGEVVWMTLPCYELEGFGQDPKHLDRDLIPRLEAARPRTEVYDLFKRVCPNDQFSRAVGPFADARPDGTHFSDEGADWVASWMGPDLVEAGRAK